MGRHRGMIEHDSLDLRNGRRRFDHKELNKKKWVEMDLGHQIAWERSNDYWEWELCEC